MSIDTSLRGKYIGIGQPREFLGNLMPDTEWQIQAACRNEPNNMFVFPGNAPRKEKKAKAICKQCNVTQECLESEMKIKQIHSLGVRGGLTLKERESLERRLRKEKKEINSTLV